MHPDQPASPSDEPLENANQGVAPAAAEPTQPTEANASTEPAEPSETTETSEPAATAETDAAGEAGAAEAPLPTPSMSLAECGAQLAARFPALFTPGQARPLKLRIQADIQARAPGVFSRKLLSAFLHRHTTSNPYLKAMAGATHRIDLDGAEAGELAEEHRSAAAAEMERRRGLHQARREAERLARREAERQARQASRPPRVGPPASGPGAERGPRPDGEAPRGAGRRADRPPGRGPQRGQDHPPGRSPERGPRRGDERAGEQAGGHGADRGPGDGSDQRPPRRDPPPAPRAPEDPAAQARRALLRAWETTTLAPNNFLALKGMTQAQLDAELTVARAERAQRPEVAADGSGQPRRAADARDERRGGRPQQQQAGRGRPPGGGAEGRRGGPPRAGAGRGQPPAAAAAADDEHRED